MRVVQRMRLSRTNLVRLGAVHAVGLGALAFATPAYAADDPPPPAVRAPLVEHTFELPDEVQLSVVAALKATNSPVDQETPANMPPPASATTQADTVRQSQSQAISPKHAQESPERASTNESQHLAVSAPSDEPQYHPRHVQYQQPSNVRAATRRLVLPTTGFSAREPKGITPPSSPIELPNRPQNGALNCFSDPDDSWSPDLPADGGATLQCTPDPLPDETTSGDPSDSVDCDDTGAQYQPDDTQYQTPAETTCDAPDDSVVPIAEPEGPASSTPGDADATAATDVVPPTTEPAAASVAPDTEPAQCRRTFFRSGQSANGSREEGRRKPFRRQAQSSSVLESEAAVARRARDLGTAPIGDAERAGPAWSPQAPGTAAKRSISSLRSRPRRRG